jgi:hypothetical protein
MGKASPAPPDRNLELAIVGGHSRAGGQRSRLCQGTTGRLRGFASWRGGQLLSGKAATRAGGPNPIPHPTGWGLPLPLWVAFPTAKQVNDLLKFGPGTLGTSVADCREAVIERRTRAGAGRAHAIGRGERASDLDLLFRLLFRGNALCSRYDRISMNRWIWMFVGRAARRGVPAFAALMARGSQRPRRPSGGICLAHGLGRGKAIESMPSRDRSKHRERCEQQTQAQRNGRRPPPSFQVFGIP